MGIRIKRIYENWDKGDGYRILVDRLWPRGLSKEVAHVDLWFKEIAPSNELRKWFHHTDGEWEEFVRRYKKELNANTEAVKKLKELVHEHKVVTLLYGAKDTEHNQAIIIRELVKE